MLDVALIALLIAAVVVLVGAPLIGGGAGAGDWGDGDGGAARRLGPGREGARAAAKEAKYREIADAELDFRAGKMTERDWRRYDAELRAEAIMLLRERGADDGEHGGEAGHGDRRDDGPDGSAPANGSRAR